MIRWPKVFYIIHILSANEKKRNKKGKVKAFWFCLSFVRIKQNCQWFCLPNECNWTESFRKLVGNTDKCQSYSSENQTLFPFRKYLCFISLFSKNMAKKILNQCCCYCCCSCEKVKPEKHIMMHFSLKFSFCIFCHLPWMKLPHCFFHAFNAHMRARRM